MGYILHIDGKRIYIAEDTAAAKEAKAVKCDIVLVLFGATNTVDVRKAAEMVNSDLSVAYSVIPGFENFEWDGELNAEDDIHLSVFLRSDGSFVASASMQNYKSEDSFVSRKFSGMKAD